MRSNCVAEALREAQRRLREPRGKHTGEDVYVWVRFSRVPMGVLHAGVGSVDPKTGQMVMESFCPVDPKPVPWWLVWTRLRFNGRWRRGDWPATTPEGQ